MAKEATLNQRVTLSKNSLIDSDFYQLYESLEPKLRGLISRISPHSEVDDIVQETFVKIFRNRDKFNGQSSVDTWACRIAINTAKDSNRKLLRMGKLISEWLIFNESFETNKQDDSNLESNQIILQLPFKERTVAVLFFIEEYKISDISELLEIPEGTVKSRLHSARSKLKSIYGEKNG